MTAFDQLLELYGVVDRTVTTLRERFPAEIACERGCADCCAAVFDVSFIEAAYLLSRFQQLATDSQTTLVARAETALTQWQSLFSEGGDPAQGRIRCPLLSEENLCSLYEGRPVNCRTYGVPTVIGGAAHVCGLSRFDKGTSYPTIQLEALQQRLFDASCHLVGEAEGRRRFPIAAVLLDPAPFVVVLE
jgi:Fe-S-cluster containining protein